jgi:hypothetical protein
LVRSSNAASLILVGKGSAVPSHVRSRHVEKVNVDAIGWYADGRRDGPSNGPVARSRDTADAVQAGQGGGFRRAAKQHVGLIGDRDG